MEIERKFLVSALPEGLEAYPSAEIEQSYLSFGDEGKPEARIRRMTKNGETVYYYTEKGEGDLCREEEEYEITAYSYGNLLELSVSSVVKKTRYYLPLDGGLTAELDVYGGELSGLTVAEVEFATPEEANAFTPPVYFGDEVTKDPKYRNKNLAKQQ